MTWVYTLHSRQGNKFMSCMNSYKTRIHIIYEIMFYTQYNTQIYVIYEFMYYTKWSPTHLVFEFEVTPIPFLMELIIDSTGEVVMVSNDMEMVFWT